VSLKPKPDIHTHPPAILDSPALYQDFAETPAFEVKFLLTAAEAAEVERRLRTRLAPDPFADPALGGAYWVTSVYFDTPAFDVYRRSDGFRRRKYRVRRYGGAPTVFLERKVKRKQQVRKKRTAVPLGELDVLSNSAPDGWPAAWFAQQLAARGLRPVCRVSYERIALVGTSHDGPIRVTFDRAARGSATRGPAPDPVANGVSLLCDEVVAEFKFLAAMPAAFKEVIEGLRLGPRPVSKYRRCVDAVGLTAEGGPDA
jgi:VTC domain